MLNKYTANSISSYSKASRGLFVQLWLTCVFTGLAISPSPSLRQYPSCYAIRAGRNLPDKEFRYLRTVIVTAGVHPRLGSRLPPPYGGMTSPLNVRTLARHHPLYILLRVKQGAVFLINSHLDSLAAARLRGQVLLRTYDRFFAEFLNEGSLVHLRLLALFTCVGLRYGYYNPNPKDFSGQIIYLN